MEKEKMKRIIDEYVKAYNSFDIDRMLKDIHEDVEFRNIIRCDISPDLKGKNDLKIQLLQAKNMFKERELKITDQKFGDNWVENKVKFTSILAADVPKGPKEGEKMELEGKSIFHFENGKIVLIEDINQE